jgi:hypothetical protein
MGMKFVKTMTLNDEHRQEVNLYQNPKGFWWKFKNWPEDSKQDSNGPFKSPSAAYLAACEYCNQLAP